MSKKRSREEKFMLAALRQAEKRLGKNGEVPIGAVIVYENKVVAKGYNRRLKKQLASAHAEMMAIDGACPQISFVAAARRVRIVRDARTRPMCMGAALNARADKLFFGAKEQKGRSLTGELAAANLLNHTMEVTGGVLEEECSGILTEFFTSHRARLKEEKSVRNNPERRT